MSYSFRGSVEYFVGKNQPQIVKIAIKNSVTFVTRNEALQ